MIDPTNIDSYLLEPSNPVQFRTLKLLYEHLEKHVFNEDERWGKLVGFQTDEIRKARRGDIRLRRKLSTQYQHFLSDKLLEYCTANRNHRHFLATPPFFPSMDEDEFRKPEQLVKCWGILENLVIIVSSIVMNGSFAPYIIKTGYRTFPKLKKKSWLKEVMNQKEEASDFVNGKKLVLIADHMEQSFS